MAFLLVFGELPSGEQLAEFSGHVMDQTAVHAVTVKLMRSFRYNAHPMGMLIAALASYATIPPQANPNTN